MTRWSFIPLALVISLFAGTVAHASSLHSVAKRLAKGLKPLPVKRVAVLAFPYHNGDLSSGSSVVSERLTTLMVARGVEVVERALLDKALGEIKLGMSGLVESSTTQKLGKTLGVSAIVTGTLIDLEDRLTEVNARLIQTETGEILAAATAHIRRTWDDLPKPSRAAIASGPGPEASSSLHMSKLIQTSSPHRNQLPTPVFGSPAHPPAPPFANGTADNGLTLTNDDLIPINHRGQTDPERILNQFLSENDPPPDAVHMARRIYHRHPDPKVRARALLAMGHVLERSGHPRMAADAYQQILREFPESTELQATAHQRLGHLASPQ